MFESLKEKDVACLLGRQDFLMQLGMKWKTLHIQQTDLGLKKKIDSGHFVPALLWFEWKLQLVSIWPCSLPQGLSSESTRIKCWTSHWEMLQQEIGKLKFSKPFQGQFCIIDNLCSSWKMTTLLCKQNASLTLASQVLLNLCALLNLCDSEY